MKKTILALVLLAVSPAAHALEADQAYVNFGSISVMTGAPQTQFVTITNTAAQATGTLEVVSNCFLPDFNVGTGCDEQNLQQNESCQIMITFKPSHQGLFNCTIRVGSASTSGESDILVQGEGQSF
jgi:hypothetical protein